MGGQETDRLPEAAWLETTWHVGNSPNDHLQFGTDLRDATEVVGRVC
jgi:hypothetical protein